MGYFGYMALNVSYTSTLPPLVRIGQPLAKSAAAEILSALRID